tara:strand:- start:833 stop:3160 length:2328 start_codon:yes stop_codon:yes gene_type:complete
MKSFRQIISERPENDKLDKLTHNVPLSNKRLKQLSRRYDAFEEFDMDGWQGYPPPSNSSKVTWDEINYLIGLQDFRTQWETDMVMSDEKIMRAFKIYLEKENLEVDLTRIKELKDQSNVIILSLKRHYNRPRPVVLAKALGLELSFFPLKTSETPSYPSGHATQGRLVANLLADELPFAHRANILAIGDRIGEGRQIAGAHYPSDTEFGHRLGDELYRLVKETDELKLEDVLKEEKVEISVMDFMPPTGAETKRTVIYEGAALVGLLGSRIMSDSEWLNGGVSSFKMKDWYNNHYIKKGGNEQAWLSFCKELGSVKIRGATDFIWSDINRYYKEAPSSWKVKSFKDNTADCIIITKGNRSKLFSVMKTLSGLKEEEQFKLTKHNESTGEISVEGVSFYQVSLKKAIGDSRIGKVSKWFADKADVGGGLHKPGDIFTTADLQFEEFIQESFFGDTFEKIKSNVSSFLSKAKKWLSKMASNLFTQANKFANGLIKREKSVKAANAIVQGLKSSGVTITEEKMLVERPLLLNKPTVKAIGDFKSSMGIDGAPLNRHLKSIEKLINKLNSKKLAGRGSNPILLKADISQLGLSSKDMSNLKELYNYKEGDTITIGEGTPFDSVLKLTSNMAGYIYINGLLNAVEKKFDSYNGIDKSVSNAIIGMSAELEGEAKFGNTALPVIIVYGGQTSPTVLGSRDKFIEKKAKELGDINLKYNDYPILVIRINKLSPHNSVNLFLLNSVEIETDHAVPTYLSVGIATSSGSKFATKVEANTTTRTY